MYNYAQAFLEQVLVSAACNGAHNLKQRLARWLLICVIVATMMPCQFRTICSPKGWVCTGLRVRTGSANWNARA
jgi:hypothetical protein